MFSAVLLVVFRILRWLGVAFEKGSKLRLLKSRDVAPLEIEIGSRSFCRWAAAAGGYSPSASSFALALASEHMRYHLQFHLMAIGASWDLLPASGSPPQTPHLP